VDRDGGSREGHGGASGGDRAASATYPAQVAQQRSSPEHGVSPPVQKPAECPPDFAAALEALATVRPRSEIVVERIPAPQRLAPWSHAVGARIGVPGDEEEELASGRFIVLFDPDGHEAWQGTTRCVGYISASTDSEMVDDSMFSEAAWSWLTDALTEHGAHHHSVGGTVTRTASTRFGSIASPEHSVDVEIRASWTAEGTDLDKHLLAFLEVLGNAAGLPPPGIHLLTSNGRTAPSGA
jgi:Protein of unknown function (DUF3000)